jgi:hypothetical protein
MAVPYRVVIEQQEFDRYASVIDSKKLLILDRRYQDEYDTFDDLGATKSKGPGAARNFAWEHSISEGWPWHWVMDDNIRDFYRLYQNRKIRVGDGTIFKAMEDFALRYENLAMCGPNYMMFAPRKRKMAPFVLNTRIYSCNLIRNDLPFRWRGRYNEDTDLSLRILKAGWCTVQFYAFLQNKMATQTVKGGCDKDFYAGEGTYPKSKMLQKMHPDLTRLVYKFGRAHHHVNYAPFRANVLRRKPDAVIPSEPQEYGMELVPLS